MSIEKFDQARRREMILMCLLPVALLIFGFVFAGIVNHLWSVSPTEPLQYESRATATGGSTGMSDTIASGGLFHTHADTIISCANCRLGISAGGSSSATSHAGVAWVTSSGAGKYTSHAGSRTSVGHATASGMGHND